MFFESSKITNCFKYNNRNLLKIPPVDFKNDKKRLLNALFLNYHHF